MSTRLHLVAKRSAPHASLVAAVRAGRVEARVVP